MKGSPEYGERMRANATKLVPEAKLLAAKKLIEARAVTRECAAQALGVDVKTLRARLREVEAA